LPAANSDSKEGVREEHMSITIGKHVFEGPYRSTQDLTNDPGIFAVIAAQGERGSLIDVGESSEIGTCVQSHPNKNRWDQFSSEQRIYYAVLYTPSLDQPERRSIEHEIRKQYS
jgi:hypothetical protein